MNYAKNLNSETVIFNIQRISFTSIFDEQLDRLDSINFNPLKKKLKNRHLTETSSWEITTYYGRLRKITLSFAVEELLESKRKGSLRCIGWMYICL